MRIRALAFILLAVLAGRSAAAQSADTTAQERHWSNQAWTTIIKHDGVDVSYIFYREADNVNNGVVVRLINRNTHPVRYAFKVVFRAGDGTEKVAQASGDLKPGEMETGESAGLYWIPFTDGRSIGEIGLRGIRVERER